MVLYTLYAKANLEGITSLSLNPTSDICISVRNSTHDQTREKIIVETSNLQEANVPDNEKHRQEHDHHFALTWNGDKTRSTIRLIDSSAKQAKKKNATDMVVREITLRDDGEYVPILQLECDGLEPYAFHPMGTEFMVIKNDGSKVDNVDLSDGEWSDFELSSGTSLIKNFESKFE
eukprot:scaffold2552_cov59-Cyclotella_meneghiniana.AAC.2